METILTYFLLAIFVSMWLYVAIPKFQNLKYYKEVMNTQAVPKWSVSLLTVLVPLSELLAAILLIIPATRLWGMYLSLALMIAFTIYVAGIILQAYNVYPCSCGGAFSRLGWRKHLRVNIYLTLFAIAGVVLLHKGYSL